MSTSVTSVPEFWKRVIDSRLLPAARCQELAARFGQVKGAANQANARTLAEWLISQNLLTRYQATVLLAGRSRPFCYGDYQLRDRLSEGPAAGSFEALHLPTRHPVLLVFFSGQAIQDLSYWSRLSDHLNRLSAVRAPHLQRCYEVVDQAEYRFAVTERITGHTAAERIAGGSPLPVGQACGMVRSAALAIAPLHQQHLAHGDLRPARLAADRRGHVRLANGLEHGVAPIDLHRAAASGRMLERAPFLAPEFLQAGRVPDPLTDIYALGCTLYALLAGRPPFAADTVLACMQLHASQPAQPLEPLGVPPPLARLVTCMTAKNPAVRIQDIAEVIAALTPLADPPLVAAAAAEPPPSFAAFSRTLRGGSASPAASAVSAVRPAGRSSAAASAGPAARELAPGTAPTVLQERLQRRRSGTRRRHLLVGAGSGALLLLVLLLVFRPGGQEGEPAAIRPSASDQGAALGSAPAGEDAVADPGAAGAKEPGAAASRFEGVEDDGRLLWMPPSEGDPVELRFVPPNSELYMVVRPAKWLGDDEGQRVAEALGPAFARARSAFERALGVELAQVQQLILSLHDHGRPLPDPAFALRLSAGVEPESLLAAWGDPPPTSFEGEVYFRGQDGWTYYLPERDPRVVVLGVETDVQEVIRAEGAPPILRLGVEKLLRVSDRDRLLTVVFTPSDLIFRVFRDGRPWSFCDPRAVREPLDWFLGEGIEAGMLSVDLGETLYLELACLGRAPAGEGGLVAAFDERLAAVPDRIERDFALLEPAPYWRMVAARYPQMVRSLVRQTRSGIEGEVLRLNAVLPRHAAHNLVFGAAMALEAGGAGGPGSGVPAAAAAAPASWEELLQQRLTIRFGQESLEFAVQAVETAVREAHPGLPFAFSVKILGGDLERRGITRNQQIRDFDAEDRTIAEIFTAMVLQANPIKTVRAPDEEDQQLIWVIGPDPDEPGRQAILLTTRAAAAEKDYRVPEVFRVKS